VFEPRNTGAIAGALRAIAKLGCRPGLALNPQTPASALEPYIELADLILVMAVWPGFGGQKFMPEMLPKIRQLRALVERAGRDIHVEVDGGIDDETGKQCVDAGADVLVAGTFVFRHKSQNLAGAIAELRSG
jgi:ribulose-phosphate 3-epimerase